MIVLYAKIPADEIREDCVKTILKIEDWFNEHPKRRVCHAEVWYGKHVNIRKGHVKEDMEKERDEALKDV